VASVQNQVPKVTFSISDVYVLDTIPPLTRRMQSIEGGEACVSIRTYVDRQADTSSYSTH